MKNKFIDSGFCLESLFYRISEFYNKINYIALRFAISLKEDDKRRIEDLLTKYEIPYEIYNYGVLLKVRNVKILFKRNLKLMLIISIIRELVTTKNNFYTKNSPLIYRFDGSDYLLDLDKYMRLDEVLESNGSFNGIKSFIKNIGLIELMEKKLMKSLDKEIRGVVNKFNMKWVVFENKYMFKERFLDEDLKLKKFKDLKYKNSDVFYFHYLGNNLSIFWSNFKYCLITKYNFYTIDKQIFLKLKSNLLKFKVRFLDLENEEEFELIKHYLTDF